MKRSKHVLLVVLMMLIGTSFGASPTGCSYDSSYSSTGIYTCIFGSYTEPLTYSAFSNPRPQRLKITNLSGSFPAGGSAFSGFSSYSSGLLDVNYPASLELVCTGTGTLTLSTGTFTDMGYLQEVKFTHCNIASLSSNMLSKFGSLNSLMFEYGSIASYTADFLTGLTIEAQSVSVPKGELVIKDCTISPTDIPAGLFDPLTTAKVIRIEHAGVTTINSAAFNLAVKLNYISLSDNSITTLDNNILTGLNSLSTLNLDGLAYDCSCSNLGLLTFASENSVNIPSGLICNTPASYQNKKATQYYSDVCKTPVSSCSDVAIGSTCMTIYDIVGYSLAVVTLVVSAIALAIICHTRRQLLTATSKMESKKNGSWTRVREIMNKNDFAGKKPPMKGAEAVHKGMAF